MERTEAEAFVVYPRVLRVARASPMSGCPPENSIAPDSSTSKSKCWPEENTLWTAELRRSCGGRRYSSFGLFSSGREPPTRRKASAPIRRMLIGGERPPRKKYNHKGDPP